MNVQKELLNKAQSKYPLSEAVKSAYMALPRHKFLEKFSIDYDHWLKVKPEYMDLIYADTTLLLYEKGEYVSTISQPSFVLLMLELLDLKPGMKVFELGAGSGWNAALMGHIVGKSGYVISYEIIPEMTKEAQRNIAQFDLPQVEVIQGDALQEMWELEEYDRGIFTAGVRDMPGILFDVIKVGGKLLFVLKTSQGDLLLVLQKMHNHFKVLQIIRCQFVNVTGPAFDTYYNNFSQLFDIRTPLTIWPQGTLNLGENILIGKDMIFKWE
jgi:protein-L-isoaspartate(D-aspartate) O-methyltransferase